MEGSYARRAFPCFDEPTYKATFDITLRHQEAYPWAEKGKTFALSNMPLQKEMLCVDGWCENVFQTTVKMSSYLVVFAIVDFGSLKTKTLVEGLVLTVQ